MIKGFFEKLLSKNDSNLVDISQTIVPQKIYLFEASQRELEHVMDSSFPEGPASGYVYFVQEHMNGTFKIGKTKNIAQNECV